MASAASNAKLREMLGDISPEERRRRMSDPHADYRKFFKRARELYMAVSPETARLLYMLARANGARSIVEFGTSFDLVGPKLRSGAFVVADNADASPEYVSRVRAKDGGYLSVPFSEDVELSLKL